MRNRFLESWQGIGLALTLGVLLVSACAGDRDDERRTEASAAGAVSGTAGEETPVTAATGPGIQVTQTDMETVRRATELKLTEESFAAFVRAADTVAALQARDSAVRAHLSPRIAGAGANEAEAGVKWLVSNDKVSNAITSAGLSVDNYFAMGIAIASAQRFVADPAAAPPTNAVRENAEFLRGKSAELERLRALESGPGGVVVRQ